MLKNGTKVMDQTIDVENQRGTERVPPAQSVVTISGQGLAEPIEVSVLDESFGGLGILVPAEVKLGKEVDVELSKAMGGVRSVALVRHIRPSANGDRIGLEWKALALSRCLRDLLQAQQSSDKHKSLARLLPGGLSVMWKLYEGGRWEQTLQSAQRLKKEAAGCQVHDLSEPIEQFDKAVRAAMDSGEKPKETVRLELDRLILRCIRVIS